MSEQLLFVGMGGQGLQAMATLIAEAAAEEGRQVIYSTTYGGSQRGGLSKANVIISDKRIGAPVTFPGEATALVAMSDEAVKTYEHYLESGALMLVNSDMVEAEPSRADIRVLKIPMQALAKEMNNERGANMIALGALLHCVRVVKEDSVTGQLEAMFTGRKAHLAAPSIEAVRRGAEAAARL